MEGNHDVGHLLSHTQAVQLHSKSQSDKPTQCADTENIALGLITQT